MNNHDHEGCEENKAKVDQKVSKEVSLLPPLLPLKFGNALLLQYTVNQSTDDKLGLLEVGLATGLTSLALVLLTAVGSYGLKSAPLVLQLRESKRKVLTRILQVANAVVIVIQTGLLILLFLYTAAHYNTVDFHDKTSNHFIKKRIYYFSFIISTAMFISALLTISLGAFLFLRKSPTVASCPTQQTPSLPPARSFLPLGLANALLGLYVGLPEDQEVGKSVFLLELCLYVGTITILVTVLQSVARIVLLVALRDGVLDSGEARTERGVQLARYAMALLQLVMFVVMFGHCIQIHLSSGQDFECPEHLLLLCTLLSSTVLGAGLLAVILGLYIAL